MNLQLTLSVITVLGLVATFSGVLLSLLFKPSVEIEGTTRKRLTKAGWVALGISAFGLSGAIASELIRASIRQQVEIASTKDRDAKAAAVVAEAKRSKMAVLASQPLSSMKLKWRFTSMDASLSQAIKAAEDAEQSNAEDSQGGVTPVPTEVMRVQTAMALIGFIARAGAEPRDSSDAKHTNGPLMLVPLDDAYNAVLFLGSLPEDADESSRSAPTPTPSPARGDFSTIVPDGLSIDHKPSKRGQDYELDWDVDPVALSRYVDRRNAQVALTAWLPETLQVVLMTDYGTSPVKRTNFAEPYAENLWKSYDDAPVDLAKFFSNMTLDLEVNGVSTMPYHYSMTRILRRELTNYDDDLGGNCLVIQFTLS